MPYLYRSFFRKGARYCLYMTCHQHTQGTCPSIYSMYVEEVCTYMEYLHNVLYCLMYKYLNRIYTDFTKSYHLSTQIARTRITSTSTLCGIVSCIHTWYSGEFVTLTRLTYDIEVTLWHQQPWTRLTYDMEVTLVFRVGFVIFAHLQNITLSMFDHWLTAIATGRRIPPRCLKLHVIPRKRATNYSTLLRKMTYQHEASYGFSPPCTRNSKWCQQRSDASKGDLESVGRVIYIWWHVSCIFDDLSSLWYVQKCWSCHLYLIYL